MAKKRYLTLNIGAATVALAEYEGGKDALTLVKYGTAALAAPIDAGNADTILVPALMDIMRDTGIKPGPVAVAVSGQMVFPRFASVPRTGGDEKFEQMIRLEVEQNIPFPIDEMICDRQILGENVNGETNVMIVAAKTDQIEELTGAVRSAGFSPTLVDVAPIALTNVLRQMDGGEACTVILDIGAKTTSLVIADGERLYTRAIPVAGQAITKEIASTLGCSADEAETFKREQAYVALGGVVEDEDETRDQISKVCRAVMTRLHAEISRSINFYRSQQGGNVPVKLYLTGGTALLPQIADFFAESLQLETAFLNPFELIAPGPQVDASALETDSVFLAATAGLALHAAGAASFAINLLPPSLVKEQADRARVPFVAAGAGMLIAALAVLLVAANRTAEVTQAKLEAVTRQQNTLRDLGDRIKKATEAQTQAVAKADALRALAEQRALTVAKFNAVRSALGANMWIEKWQGDRITIRGWSDDLKEMVEKAKSLGQTTASKVVAERLKASAAVDPASVKIDEMTTLGKEGEIEQFVVIVKFGKEEASK